MAGSVNDEVRVRAVRPFEGEEGFKDAGSPPFRVGRRRAAELKASWLVEDHDEPEAKQAAAPENKMAEAASNKNGPGVERVRGAKA